MVLFFDYLCTLTNKLSKMKVIYSALFASALLIGCQPAEDNSANEAFERNSKVVLAELEGWSTESMDFDALYAEDALVRPTGFGSPDSLSLDDIKAHNQEMWDMFDFELLHDVVLLPGVNPETKKADGSVRYYNTWKVTLPATDSTEARSGELKFYESYDFNSEGKIVFQQGYGDFGGLMKYLFEDDDDDSEDESEEEEG
jgi:hypothetical protein